MVYLSISRKVKNYTKQILFASMILLNRGKNDSEKGQLTMKNKLKSCAILATLGAITIHLINKTLIEMATKDSLLNSSEGNYYDWRFGKIYYRKQGNGKPLLLLHDLDAESSGVEWKKVAAILAEKHTVYTVDLLGCGRSEKPNITYTNFLYVQMLTDFIKHIIGEKADVVATGESAAIAVMACGNDENVIGKICMVNPLSLTELAKCPNKRTKTLKFLIEIPIIGTLLYNIIHSREAIDEKFVYKYLYDEDAIDYQMTKIYHESAHNENAHSKYLFASIKGGYTKTNIYHCIRKATNSICIISGQYDENSIEIAKQYQKHVPAIECMCIKDTRHLPQIEQPEGFAEQLDILFSAE